MELRISFPGGKRVQAAFDGFAVETDQPKDAGGDASAPAPFDLFLASLGTCAGLYVLGFCQARGLSTEGVELVQHVTFDAQTRLPSHIDLRVRLPLDFPEKYRVAVVRAAEHCKVKKMLASPPTVTVSLGEASPLELAS